MPNRIVVVHRNKVLVFHTNAHDSCYLIDMIVRLVINYLQLHIAKSLFDVK